MIMNRKNLLAAALGLILRSYAQAQDAALLITNGLVFGHPEADSILIAGNRIAAVGRSADLKAKAPANARILDAAGGQILPGLHDAHAHLMAGGLAALQLEISLEDTLQQIVDKTGRYAAQRPELDRIMGRGWSYDIVAKEKFPTRRDLDRAAADRPVVLESYDGHALWLNSKALKLARITVKTKDPEGGRIVRDPDGSPQGVLLENAMDLAEKAFPKPDRKTQLKALEAALRRYLELGVTSVTDLSPSEDGSELALFQELREQDKLPIRVSVSFALDGDINLYDKLRRKQQKKQDLFISIGPLKGFVDGVVESKTAYMLKPYENSSSTGQPQIPAEKLKELVSRAHARGFAVALHAVADAAVRLGLDAFAEAQRQNPGVKPRHRIEHGELIDAQDLPRFKTLDVTASMQPLHAASGEANSNSGAWSQNLGAQRVAASFPFKALLEQGAVLAFGSDWPVASPDPLQAIASAASSMPIDEAVKAYTFGSAYALNREQEIGRIQPGFLADLVVLPPEIQLSRPYSLWHGHARYVIVDGRIGSQNN